MKPHLITLPPCLADLWESITKDFGFFRFRWENQVATLADKEDLQAAWEIFVFETDKHLAPNK